MKTVVFFGSARAQGVTRRMVDTFLANVPGEVVLFDAYCDFLNIHPCMDCRYCWSHPHCIFQDEMNRVYDALTDADVIVIASPVYFFGIPGVLKTMMDRLQVYWAAHIRKDEPFAFAKQGAMLLCGGAPPHDGQFDSARQSGFGMLRELRAELTGCVTLAQTDCLSEQAWQACETEIAALAKCLYP